MKDKTKFHKTKIVKAIFKRKFYGIWFIPQYKPQFAIIELYFKIIKSKIKVKRFEYPKIYNKES